MNTTFLVRQKNRNNSHRDILLRKRRNPKPIVIFKQSYIVVVVSMSFLDVVFQYFTLSVLRSSSNFKTQLIKHILIINTQYIMNQNKY